MNSKLRLTAVLSTTVVVLLCILASGKSSKLVMSWRNPGATVRKFHRVLALGLNPVSAMMIALGQHTRAGIEDNLWAPKKSVPASTIDMIEWQISVAQKLSRPIATAEQTHQMLKIGVWYKSTDETLAKIGLPPNREGGNQGFLVLKTDGKLHQAAQGGCGHIHAGEWEEQVAAEEEKAIA